MARWSGWLGLSLGLAAACSKLPAESPEALEPQNRCGLDYFYPKPGDIDKPLAEAREKRRAAEALVFTKPASDELLAEAFSEWLQRRYDATSEAARSYDAARSSALGNELSSVWREVGEMHLAMVEAAVQTALSLSLEAERAHAVEAHERSLDAARQAFVDCVAHAEHGGVIDANGAACQAQLGVIEQLLHPVTRVPGEAPERPRQPIVQKSPCSWRGTSTFPTPIFAQRTSGESRMTLEDFDVESLQLPQHEQGRATLHISYPFKAVGYVELDAGLVVTARRIELGRSNFWLDPQTPVRAFGPRGKPRVTIKRPSGPMSNPMVELEVECKKLTMAAAPPLASRGGDGVRAELSGLASLFESPNGKYIGRSDLTDVIDVRVLAREGDWLHVTTAQSRFGSAPFQFDAWVQGELAPHTPKRAVDVAERPLLVPTRVTTAPLQLRLSSNASASAFVELVTGVPILVARGENGMRRILFNAARSDDRNEFWVSTHDLATKTKLLE